MKYYSPSHALEFVTKNGVGVYGDRILRGNYGIKVWGAIDYLTNKHRYIVVNKL